MLKNDIIYYKKRDTSEYSQSLKKIEKKAGFYILYFLKASLCYGTP